MKFKSVLTILAASTSVFIAQPALAQSTDTNAAVVVRVDIVDPQFQLSVTPRNEMRFGEVTRPANSVSGGSNVECRYDLVSTTPTGSISVAQLNNGSVSSSGVPTPNGCSADGNVVPGHFTVACPAGSVIGLQIGVVSDTVQGRVLELGQTGTATNAGQTSPILSFNPSAGPATINCPTGSSAGQTAGTFDVYVGARLRVGTNFVLSFDDSAGDMQLTAFF